MNNFDWRLLFVALPFIILIVGLITLFLSRAARGSNKAIPFAMIYGLGVSAWLASLIYIIAIKDVMAAHRIGFTAAYVLAIGALGLALTFPNNTLTKKNRVLMFFDGAVCLAFGALILFTNLVITPDDFYVRPVSFQLLGMIFLAIAGLHLLVTLIIAFYRYRKEVQSRLYFNYIVLAFGVTILISAATNLILPLAGVTNLAIGGPISSLLPFIAVVYALGINNINDFRYTLAQLLHIAGRFALLALFVMWGHVLDVLLHIEPYSLRWTLIMLLTAVVGVTGYYALSGRLQGVIDDRIAYSGQSPEQARSKLMTGLSKEIELDKNTSFIIKFIKEAVGVRTAGIVLRIDDEKYRSIGDFTLSQKEAEQIYQWMRLAGGATSAQSILQRKDFVENRNMYSLAKQKEFHGVMALGAKADVKGFYVFGEKYAQDIFTRQDDTLLGMIGEIADLSIERAIFYDRVKAFSLTLQEKIDDATRKLRRANDKLRRLNETKDDFISMASHQLRTPLTSVKGYVSMVLDGDAGNITRLQRRLLTQSFVSSQRMVYLISDLLNVSRLKTGKFLIEPVRTNLAKVIQEEVEQLVETAKSRHLELVYTKPEHFPALMLDETKLRQVIMNFLDNAVYYTPAGGHIEVHLVDKPQTVEFTVVDDGIGVPRHEQHHLFTKFYRAPNAKRARPDGTGLGLFMAKKVIIAQGGAVIFKSQEGRGSTFGFTFAKAGLLPADGQKSGEVAVAPSLAPEPHKK